MSQGRGPCHRLEYGGRSHVTGHGGPLVDKTRYKHTNINNNNNSLLTLEVFERWSTSIMLAMTSDEVPGLPGVYRYVCGYISSYASIIQIQDLECHENHIRSTFTEELPSGSHAFIRSPVPKLLAPPLPRPATE